MGAGIVVDVQFSILEKMQLCGNQRFVSAKSALTKAATRDQEFLSVTGPETVRAFISLLLRAKSLE
jgi:hypothetical protein